MAAKKRKPFSSQKPNTNIGKILSKGRRSKKKVSAKDMSKAPSSSTTGIGVTSIPSRSSNSGSMYHSGSGI
ncbi:MAG TPA: hypothetical protein VEP90_09615 [Methylomirabilota bacterium]|nr:hypothetical protein [Methylomirabilota bacterium]